MAYDLWGSLPSSLSCAGSPYVMKRILAGQQAMRSPSPESLSGQTTYIPRPLPSEPNPIDLSERNATKNSAVSTSGLRLEEPEEITSGELFHRLKLDEEEKDEDDEFVDARDQPWVDETDTDDASFVSVSASLTPNPLSPQELAEDLPALLMSFERKGLKNETISMMHPHGVFGLILEDCPEKGIPLARARLSALALDVENWWNITSSKQEARDALNQLDSLLEEGSYEDFLEGLLDFETKHSKSPFYLAMHDCFTGKAAPVSIELFTPAKAGLLLNSESVMESLQLKKQSAATSLNETYLPPPDDWNNAAQILEHLLTDAPEVVRELLFAKCSYDIKNAWQRMKSGKSPKSAYLRMLTERQRAATELENPEGLRQFIHAPTNNDLKLFLAGEAQKLVFQKRFQQLMSLDLSTLPIDELNDLEIQVGYTLALEKCPDWPSEFATEMTAQLKLYQHALELTRFMNAEKDDPLAERVFMLKAPSTQHLMKALKANKKDAEGSLYEAIDLYIKHLKAYNKRSHYSTIVAFQKTRHDLRLAQEELLMFETKALLVGAEHACVMTPGTYQNNTTLLKLMDRVLQETVPVRPSTSHSEAVLTLGYNTLWKGRSSLNDKLAELQHIKDLKACNYSFWKELTSICKAVPGAEQDLLDKVSRVAQPAASQVQEWINGDGSAWSLIVGVQSSYTQLETEVSLVLEGILKVAERQPRLFRRLIGDSAQTFEQLKMLGGTQSAGFISELQIRLQAESAASCFAGDTAVIDDIDFTKHPKEADMLRRFQFLLEVSDIALKGTTALNLLRNLTTDTAGSRIGNAIGATAGFILGGGLFGMAIGYRLGGVVGAVVTGASHVAGTVIIREGVNGLEGRSVRALNLLVNYGPMFAFATSPLDDLALTARGVAKRQGIVKTFLNVVFSPQIFRLTKLAEALQAIRMEMPGAWSQLAKEGAKCLIVLGGSVAASALISGGVFYSGLLAVALSPFLATSAGFIVTGVLSSHLISRFMNRLEQTHAVIEAATSYYRMLLPVGSAEADRIESHCQRISEKLMAKMTAQSPFKQYVRETIASELSTCYWAHWADLEEDKELVKSLNKGIDAEMQVTEKARGMVAAEIYKFQQALSIFKEYADKAEELSNNPTTFIRFQEQLKQWGMTPPEISQGIGYYLQDQLLEIPLAITRQCGTPEPGETQEDIYRTLTRSHREIIKGDYLIKLTLLGRPVKRVLDGNEIRLVHLDKQDLEEITQRVLVQLNSNLETQISTASQERVHLAIDTAFKEVAKSLGNDKMSACDLKTPQVITMVHKQIKDQKKNIAQMQQLRVQAFKRKLEANPLYQKMSPEQRGLVFAQSVVPQVESEEE